MKISLNVSLLLLAVTLTAISCDKLNWDDPDRDGSKTECIDKSKIDKDANCPMVYKPVCGCDGVTYGNACQAENAGVTKWTEGTCENANKCIDESKISRGPCPANIDPVCGCDDITYNNACEAERAGVTKWKKGKCKKPSTRNCIDKSKINNNPCPENIDFVCGCDGETYNNACNAERAGVTKWKKGRCN